MVKSGQGSPTAKNSFIQGKIPFLFLFSSQSNRRFIHSAILESCRAHAFVGLHRTLSHSITSIDLLSIIEYVFELIRLDKVMGQSVIKISRFRHIFSTANSFIFFILDSYTLIVFFSSYQIFFASISFWTFNFLKVVLSFFLSNLLPVSSYNTS